MTGHTFLPWIEYAALHLDAVEGAASSRLPASPVNNEGVETMPKAKKDTRRNDGAAGIKRDRFHAWMRRRWEQRAAEAAARRAAEGQDGRMGKP